MHIPVFVSLNCQAAEVERTLARDQAANSDLHQRIVQHHEERVKRSNEMVAEFREAEQARKRAATVRNYHNLLNIKTSLFQHLEMRSKRVLK